MSWAKKRQLAYLGGLALFVVIFILLPAYYLLREEPTCFDNQKNGDETGVDCGGTCEKVCEFEAGDPIVIWDESFETRTGLWSAAAYIENPNNAMVAKAPYSFRLLDAQGILVAERSGVAYIPPRQTFVILETQIEVGNRVPTQEFFEFERDRLEWTKAEGTVQPLEILSVSLEARSQDTKLSAIILNPTTSEIREILISGIIYDIDGNALDVSQAYLPEIGPGSQENVAFTWPRIFDRNITRKEVIYIVQPRQVF